jgi:hypothetical protein
MKAVNYILMLLLVLIGSACERTLEFEDPADETANDIVVNAVAVAGTPFKVYLNRAYLVNKIPPMQYYNYYAGSTIQMQDDGSFDYHNNEYFQKNTISNATVEVTVNGQTKYPMSFDEKNFCYVSSYIPNEGDRIDVACSSEGQEVHAETIVPMKPRIEVVDHEVIQGNPYIQIEDLTTDSDTIMRLTCCISDEGGKQYYRLRIRNECTSYEYANYYNDENNEVETAHYVYYTMQDVFFSEDELFVDSRLTSNFGGWKAYFSNVFDNSLLAGKTYSFMVDSPKAGKHNFTNYYPFSGELSKDGEIIPSRVMVELQAISPELYRYLKTMQLYRISANDGYAEPVQIYSNVKNGWGILGALSYDRHFVEYGD